ncbi:MAG: hypothetical protein ACHQ7N_03660 [Candidatus Methylomirabilales bacterium]
MWLFIAVSLIGLLGFVTTLSTGGGQKMAGNDGSRAAAFAQQ